MINWMRVTDLRDEVGKDAFGEVVFLFLEEVEEVIARLSDGPAPDRLPDDLHFLKGSAMSLDFYHFARLCQKGEQQAKAAGVDTVDLTGLFDAYTSSKSEFLSRADELGVAA